MVVAGAVSPQAIHRTIDQATQERIVVDALTALADRQSTWRIAELVRELAAAVPTDVAVATEHLVPWLDRLAEAVTAQHLVVCPGPSLVAQPCAGTGAL